MSACDNSLKEPLKPAFPVGQVEEESKGAQQIIEHLSFQSHPEGGYFVETDRDQLRVPNPFEAKRKEEGQNSTRNASTTIHYLITPKRYDVLIFEQCLPRVFSDLFVLKYETSPQGSFHRNLARTVHTLHSGRGRYVLLHPQEGKKARVETFVVGHDMTKGEKLQWIVEGGIFKASYLLPDEDSSHSDGLLISETVVPGFEFSDHDFMSPDLLRDWVSEEQAKELSWLVREE